MKQIAILLFFSIGIFLVSKTSSAQSNAATKVPGIVIDYSPASSGKYIGSPSICILPNGDYIASHDFFGPKGSERTRAITWIFSSHDKGKNWKHIAEINGQFWSNLFVVKNDLYILGTYKEYGNLVIRKSTDNGLSWSEPENNQTGLLREGRYHTAPTPTVLHNGRIWRSIEHATGPSSQWARSFAALTISAPIESDLLNTTSWTFSSEKLFDSTYLNGQFGGWLEGNAVVDKKGNMLDILRVATSTEGKEYAAIIHVSPNEKESSFNPETGFISFPGGSKKFSIRYDKKSDRYWTVGNYIPKEYSDIKNTGSVRNTLALYSSKDLIAWDVNKILLQNPDVKKHGFQYIDWQFAGKDIVFVSRTAFDDAEGGARNYHDANYLTFHRVKKFRRTKNNILN
ncbi:MAG: exo-alpha-sialidase [Ginsengibacter sp.]